MARFTILFSQFHAALRPRKDPVSDTMDGRVASWSCTYTDPSTSVVDSAGME
jgi:hypothetical protein